MKIFFVGLSGVPYASRACDIRLDSFALLFQKCGYDVTVLNRYSPCSDEYDSSSKKEYEIVELIKHRKSSPFNFLFLLLSVVKELMFLVKYRLKNNSDVILHVYTGHYFDLCLYYIISKVCGYKIIYQYVEYRLDEKRGNLYHKINAWLVDKKGAKLWDGVIPISHFLKEKALEVNSLLKCFIGPPICNFTQFQSDAKKENVVLYCGHAGYFDVIKLVVDSYTKSNISSSYRLVLVVAGSYKQLMDVRKYAPTAIVKTKLPYDDLIKEYNRAKVLLIPLRNSIKDISRFPNKICEYSASKGVIVTTKYGEPAHFFKDKESAVISNECTVDSISDSLNWIYQNESKIESIGNKGYEVGLKYFDLISYQDGIKDFINSLK